jgi:uncharacterized FAD-dependent dehydrogenase
MIKEVEIKVKPDFIDDYEFIGKEVARKFKFNPAEIKGVRILKRSIDARRKEPVYVLRLLAFINEELTKEKIEFQFKHVENSSPVAIVGSGPAGLFAALKLLELGYKPVIFERGKDVRSRRKDLKAIQRFSKVNPNSNYCFGEGGAGTYSDGKLYTRSKKRGDVERILRLFVLHGATENILIDSRPHIGSNKLPKVIETMRQTILEHGGEIRFESKVTDLIIENDTVKGVIINESDEYLSDAVILAVGHSARDVYYMLARKGLHLEAKEFAMGVRIEHPQQVIDKIQYHSWIRHPKLPAASYSIRYQTEGRGVYSFCMCPGGIIIPASTSENEIVLNGMSTSRRDSPFANSGLVVTVAKEDLKDYEKFGVFAGLEFQMEFERRCFEITRSQAAPAQKATDFVKGRISDVLNATSYLPGIKSAPLHEILPRNISERLRNSLLFFGKNMRGFYSEEAQILAPESRTSSPVRIPRDRETLMHIQIKGLFPSGEGAGYAGGIVSAAIDGEKSAEAAVKWLRSFA